MSNDDRDDDDKRRRRRARIANASFEVGYGKPPTEHQFKPGNPGRPRGSKNKAKPAKAAELLGMIRRSNQQSYKLKDGQTLLEFEYIWKSIVASASKGKTGSQRLYMDYTLMAERAQREALAAQLKEIEETIASIEAYKDMLRDKLETAVQLGRPDLEPLPHPDHLHVDYQTGVVRITGPVDLKEKEQFDLGLQRIRSSEKEVRRFNRMLRCNLDAEARAMLERNRSHSQFLVDLLRFAYVIPANENRRTKRELIDARRRLRRKHGLPQWRPREQRRA